MDNKTDWSRTGGQAMSGAAEADPRTDECNQREQTTMPGRPSQRLPPWADAPALLRQRAIELRIEAEGLDALANALPSGLATLSPRANETLIRMFGSAGRIFYSQ